jgi:hypothetical protein
LVKKSVASHLVLRLLIKLKAQTRLKVAIYRGLPVLLAGAKPGVHLLLLAFSDTSSPALAKSLNHNTQEPEGPKMGLVIPSVRAWAYSYNGQGCFLTQSLEVISHFVHPAEFRH